MGVNTAAVMNLRKERKIKVFEDHKGFYFGYQEEAAWGFSFSVVYIPEEKDFQISMMIGNIALAIGYSF